MCKYIFYEVNLTVCTLYLSIAIQTDQILFYLLILFYCLFMYYISQTKIKKQNFNLTWGNIFLKVTKIVD